MSEMFQPLNLRKNNGQPENIGYVVGGSLKDSLRVRLTLLLRKCRKALL